MLTVKSKKNQVRHHHIVFVVTSADILLFGPFCWQLLMPSVPSRRRFHFSAGRNRSTFYWGGATWDRATDQHAPVTDLQYLYELDVVRDEWKKHLLKGQHPPGVYEGACAVVGSRIYLYGGRDKEGERKGSLFELNLSTKSWRELSHPGTGGPNKKSSCGMVAYNSTLIIYGGMADDGATNELHIFDLKAGKYWHEFIKCMSDDC